VTAPTPGPPAATSSSPRQTLTGAAADRQPAASYGAVQFGVPSPFTLLGVAQ
jgi:hypothetical protein